MSLYHFSVKQVSRGKGQTVVGSAVNITVRQSRQSGVARATCPD